MNNIIEPHILATQVLRAYSKHEEITNIEFHNDFNMRSKQRCNINGTINIMLVMHYERMTNAVYRLNLSIHDKTWRIKSDGHIKDVNVAYDQSCPDCQPTYMMMRMYAETFVDTVLKLKTVEGHGFLVD